MKQLQADVKTDVKPKSAVKHRVFGVAGKVLLVGALGVAAASPGFLDYAGRMGFNEIINQGKASLVELEKTNTTKQEWAKQRLLEIDKGLVSCVGHVASSDFIIAFPHGIEACHTIATREREEVTGTLANIATNITNKENFVVRYMYGKGILNILFTLSIFVLSAVGIRTWRVRKEENELSKSFTTSCEDAIKTLASVQKNDAKNRGEKS
jgi:hypothetical protein